MKAIPMHADVWVIEKEQAFLFRQADQRWVEELRLSYDEFSGSATALSSFSLPETAVYLNVLESETVSGMWAEHTWAGTAEDPPRIIEIPANAFHQQVLTEIRSMGKSAQVICSKKPAQFSRATAMQLLNKRELKQLKNFMNSRKSGAGKILSSFQLYLGLWIKPAGTYQAIRGVAVASVLGTFLLTGWQAKQHQLSQEKANLQQFKNSLAALPVASQQAPFPDWLEQIRKFGHSERANLVSLKMSWNEQGEILTHASLERDRKRVPKGCTLKDATQAQCSLGASNQ